MYSLPLSPSPTHSAGSCAAISASGLASLCFRGASLLLARDLLGFRLVSLPCGRSDRSFIFMSLVFLGFFTAA
jgi:hypothetical protein